MDSVGSGDCFFECALGRVDEIESTRQALYHFKASRTAAWCSRTNHSNVSPNAKFSTQRITPGFRRSTGPVEEDRILYHSPREQNSAHQSHRQHWFPSHHLLNYIQQPQTGPKTTTVVKQTTKSQVPNTNTPSKVCVARTIIMATTALLFEMGVLWPTSTNIRPLNLEDRNQALRGLFEGQRVHH
jgi:hypothetical protein